MPVFRVVLWGAVMAGATRLVGWWAVPLVAAGAARLPDVARASAGGAALAAALGWGALLAWGAVGAGLGAVGIVLGRVFSLPPAAVLALTLALPALLAWSAAALAEEAAAARRGAQG